MKTAVLSFFLVLSASFSWAQDGSSATLAGQSAKPPSTMHHDMGAMRQHPIEEMKAQVQKMRSTLDQMKVNLAKVKDPALKQQSQLDVDLWEAMVKHMEGMVSTMSEADGMGTGMMQGGPHSGMGCCAGMKDSGCCGEMKSGAGCCGGNKCMHGSSKNTQPAPDQPAPQ